MNYEDLPEQNFLIFGLNFKVIFEFKKKKKKSSLYNITKFVFVKQTYTHTLLIN